MHFKVNPPSQFWIQNSFWDASLTGNRAKAVTPLYLQRYKLQRLHDHMTCHDYWEMLAVISGRGKQRTPNASIHVERGCIILMPPEIPHIEEPDGSMEVIWLGLEGDALNKFDRHAPTGLAGKPQLTEKLAELWLRSQLCGLRGGPELDGLTLALLSRFWCESMGKMKADGAGRIEKAVGFFNERFAEKISIAGLAKLCGLSHGRFALVFKEAMGKRPVEYLESLRMRHALRLLENTGMSIRDIAKSAGYQSEFYFSRKFKKLFGKAPDIYRRTLR